MTTHARDWLELRDLLREHLDEMATDKLMDFLPPVGWADVATKPDLDAMRLGFEAALHRELTRHMRWTISTMIATATVAVGAAAVLG